MAVPIYGGFPLWNEPADPYAGGWSPFSGGGGMQAIGQGLTGLGAGLLSGRNWSEGLSRGLLGANQGIQQGQQDAYQRAAFQEHMAQSRIGNAEKLDEINRNRWFLGQSPLSMKDFQSGNWSTALPSDNAAPAAGGSSPAAPGAQAASLSGGQAAPQQATSAGDDWRVYITMADRAQRAGLYDVAKSYRDMALAMPSFKASVARGEADARNLSDLQYKPQITEANNRVDLAWKPKIAGAEAYARLPAENAATAFRTQQEIGANETKLKQRLKYEPQIAGAESDARLPAQVALAQQQADIGYNSQTGVQGRAEKLRDDFNQNKNVQNYQVVVPVIDSMRDAVNRPGGASDLNIVYGMAKILDPNSVVREGETWMVRDTSNLPQEIQGLLGKVTNGQRLPDDVRKALLTEAESRVTALKSAYDSTAKYYASAAKAAKVDPSVIINDITPQQPAAGKIEYRYENGALVPVTPGGNPTVGRW